MVDLGDDNEPGSASCIRSEGRIDWRLDDKRVERIWRREGLKVPQKQPPRRRLWLTDGSCVRLRATQPNHVWAYDFMATRTEDGRPVKLLTIIDEYTRECLAIDVARRLRSDDVLFRLAELFVQRGVPQHIRSDNVLHQERNSHKRKISALPRARLQTHRFATRPVGFQLSKRCC